MDFLHDLNYLGGANYSGLPAFLLPSLPSFFLLLLLHAQNSGSQKEKANSLWFIYNTFLLRLGK